MTEGLVKKLDVYRRAYALALAVHRESLGFPEIERFALADQMRRASRSVFANVAEGYSRQRQGGADWKRFIIQALGSADEMASWCAFARDLGYVDAARAEEYRRDYGEIARMAAGLIRAWDQRSSGGTRNG